MTHFGRKMEFFRQNRLKMTAMPQTPDQRFFWNKTYMNTEKHHQGHQILTQFAPKKTKMMKLHIWPETLTLSSTFK